MGLVSLAVLFIVLAFVAYVMGEKGFAGFSMDVAKWLIIIFVILAILSAVFG